MDQQIITGVRIARYEQVGADGVEEDGHHGGGGVWPLVAEMAQDGQRGLAPHTPPIMGA